MNATTQMQQTKLETQQQQQQQQQQLDCNIISNNSKTNNNQMSVGNQNQKQQKQHNSSYMSPPPATTARSPSPDGTRDYDVTRMREEDFERLAVYIVPDVQCERGISNRADKTLPRSLTLKPSMVFSSPNVKVITDYRKKNFIKK